jgi:hypothetical protein
VPLVFVFLTGFLVGYGGKEAFLAGMIQLTRSYHATQHRTSGPSNGDTVVQVPQHSTGFVVLPIDEAQ